MLSRRTSTSRAASVVFTSRACTVTSSPARTNWGALRLTVTGLLDTKVRRMAVLYPSFVQALTIICHIVLELGTSKGTVSRPSAPVLSIGCQRAEYLSSVRRTTSSKVFTSMVPSETPYATTTSPNNSLPSVVALSSSI